MNHLRRARLSFFVLAMATQVSLGQPLFRDDFASPDLQAGWTIVRPDASTYSLSEAPGFFEIQTTRGLLGEQGTARNLLVRPITGNYILETRLEFDPRDGQPFAGLLIYEDDAHAVSIGLVYASGERGEFRGVVMLNVGDNIDLTNRPAAKYDESNVSTPGVVYLRLLRQGNQFVGAYSDDGTAYRELGTVTNNLDSSLSVGVGAANGDSANCGPACDVPIPARFDYFQISDVDDGGVDPPVQGALESVSVQGPEFIDAGGTGTFQAIAKFAGDGTDDVTAVAEWTVAPPGIGTIEDGVFKPAAFTSDRIATVVATYTHLGQAGSVTETGAVLVRVAGNSQGTSNRLCGAGIVIWMPFGLCLLPLRGHNNPRRNRLTPRSN